MKKGNITTPDALLQEVIRQTQIELSVVSLRELQSRTGVGRNFLNHIKKGEHCTRYLTPSRIWIEYYSKIERIWNEKQMKSKYIFLATLKSTLNNTLNLPCNYLRTTLDYLKSTLDYLSFTLNLSWNYLSFTLNYNQINKRGNKK